MKLAQTEASSMLKSVYASEIAEKISEFFGCTESANSSASPDSVNWRVPPSSRPLAKFIIAFVPDPVHTHLALLFDRDIEALQSAVPQVLDSANRSYVFDRSILPWKVPSPQQNSSAAAAAEIAKARM